VSLAQQAEVRIHGCDIRSKGCRQSRGHGVQLPCQVNGDKSMDQRVREALRALLRHGFFRDVEINRDGIAGDCVLERFLSRESRSGNKDIKSEDCKNRCATSGLWRARPSNAPTTRGREQYLTGPSTTTAARRRAVDSKVEDLGQQRGGVNLESRREPRQNPQLQHRRQHDCQAKDILETLTLTTPT